MKKSKKLGKMSVKDFNTKEVHGFTSMVGEYVILDRTHADVVGVVKAKVPWLESPIPVTFPSREDAEHFIRIHNIPVNVSVAVVTHSLLRKWGYIK